MTNTTGRHRHLDEILREVPFVRIVIVFLLGIVFQCSRFAFTYSTFITTIALLAIYLFTLFLPFSRRYSRQWVNGVLGLLFLFFAGITLVQQQPKQSSLPAQEEIYVQAVVDSKPVPGARFLKVPVEIQAYQQIGEECRQRACRAVESEECRQRACHAVKDKRCKEKSVLYLEPDSTMALPALGDTLLALVKLTPLPPPQNPDEFDYKTYMARKGVFVTGFVRAQNYTVVPAQSLAWRYWPAHLQARAGRIFDSMGLAGDELAVLNALTLGDRTDIDRELNKAFTAAGVTHILSVSGLHVGIIFAILTLALSFLGRSRRGLLIKNTVIIISLWIYAAVSGFSPSVNRATVMFSFVLAGKMMQRDISIYNSLAASAFFICLFYPMDLFSIGFQLSYLALTSLVYFQPYIYKLLYVPNKLLNYFWQLISVSVAAQIATLPLTLYVFHQFPNYFMVSNIWVIPLTGVTTYLSVALLLFNWVPYLSFALTWLLDKALWLLNSGVRFTEQLPYSVSGNISITTLQYVLLIAFVLVLVICIETRSRKWLLALAYGLVIFFALNVVTEIEQRQQRVLAVYNVKNSSYIHLIDGKNSVALRDTVSAEQNFEFNLQSFFLSRGLADAPVNVLNVDAAIKDTLQRHIGAYRGFILFGDKVIKILNSERQALSNSVPVDYLIVTSTCRQPPEKMLDTFVPAQIILDASVPPYRSKLWETAAAARQIALHNVKTAGAWVQVHK